MQHLFSLAVHSFVVQKVHVRHRDCYSSKEDGQGLRRRRSCSFRTLLVSAKIENFFHNCNRQCRFSRKQCGQDIAFWKSFRKARRSRCCSCRRSNPAILFAELIDLLRLAQVLKERFLVLMALELFDQLLDLVLAICILMFDYRKGMPGILKSTALFQVSVHLFDSLGGSQDDLASWSR